MGSETHFSFGDRVVHATKPEWGVGQVISAQLGPEGADGVRRQSLKVRFERAGIKSISTEFAPLRPAADAPAVSPTPDDDPFHAGRPPEEVMSRLPEETLDPFRSLRARIESTFALYRFQSGGGSLIDWASVQTGLNDPMVRFNRHELEQFFQRFANARDAHLRKLLADARREDPEALAYALKAAPPEAAETVRRFRSMG